MELTYDWQSFQSMFYPKRRSATGLGAETAGAVYLIIEDKVIVAAFAEGEDVSDWIGAKHEDMAVEMPHRELLLFERQAVDGWLVELTSLSHLHEQLEFLRKKATETAVSSRNRCAPHLGYQHFLLEAIQSWWGKVLPSAYGIFIRLEGQHARDLFVLVRRGRLECFHEPDLTSMGRERCKVAPEVVKYLSEKHLVPVQGVFVPAQTWAGWSNSPTPWGKVAFAVKTNEAKLVPFRWGLVSLMASRAFLGL
ncbi:hypothetical protein WDW37_08625 [Bdellovibrionota bacterium FG-1]